MADQRPNQPLHKPGAEMRTVTNDRAQRWRQYGWIGQTGALYSLGEYQTEPGSYSPLWVLVDNEPKEERNVETWLA